MFRILARSCLFKPIVNESNAVTDSTAQIIIKLGNTPSITILAMPHVTDVIIKITMRGLKYANFTYSIELNPNVILIIVNVIMILISVIEARTIRIVTGG